MKYKKLDFEAIGTHWQIDLNQGLEADEYDALLQKIQGRTETFDKAYSRFRADSLVTKMSKNSGTYDLSADGFAMLQFYEQLYHITNGLVTPLIGQLMADAGYDADYSFKPKTLTPPPKWQDVITYDQHHITTSQPVLLDFGAAGKGYLVDIIAALLKHAGLDSFVINASGDILHRTDDQHSIAIGLENPSDHSEAIGTTMLHNKSLCASSGSKRKWQDLHHIIDPATLKPASETIATWVITDDTMTADGLATALFFVSPAQLAKKFRFAYAALGKDMSLSYSKNFPLTVFEAAYE